MSEIPCCNEWEEAQVSGTGSEMYGSLLGKIGDDWHIGCDLRPVAFCPWCGAVKTIVHPVVAAARSVVKTHNSGPSWAAINKAIENLAAELEKLK